MLLALVGITGVGKSFFVDKISQKLYLEKVHTIRTRAARVGEDKQYFMSDDELNKLNEEGKIAYKFGVFGGQYGYLKDEIFSNKNMIFEMHYTTIYDWKKVRPDIKTIYIFPSDIELAKQKTLERHLPKEKEIERLTEMDEHYNKIISDDNLRNQFDYFFYNNYDQESEQKLLTLVDDILRKESN
jgi:guanylate kinase